jgi:hypothetical protein
MMTVDLRELLQRNTAFLILNAEMRVVYGLGTVPTSMGTPTWGTVPVPLFPQQYTNNHNQQRDYAPEGPFDAGYLLISVRDPSVHLFKLMQDMFFVTH